MPRNNTGGNKSKKGANKKVASKKGIVFADEEQAYAKVLGKLGSCRFEVEMIYDSSKKVGKVKGSMKNRVWINKDDIVLVSLRDCNSHDDNIVDILHKYNGDDIHILNQNNELKKITKIEEHEDEDIFFKNDSDNETDMGPGLVDGSLDDFISNI
jgi:initiation factor 1A